MTVFDHAGAAVKAQFFVETGDGITSVVVESRGGSIGAPNERNAQYNMGLDLILERLAELNAILADAVIDTQQTQRQGLSHDARRLAIEAYPIRLASVDLPRLRRDLCAAQRSIGRAPDAKGSGNNTKRMRLYVGGVSLGGDNLAQWLARHPIASSIDEDINEVARPLAGGRKHGLHLDAGARRAIELQAMKLVREYLLTHWEHIDDDSATESCDFICRKGQERIFVEVKGTTTSGEKIILTRNEVALARAHAPQTLLAVVWGIVLDRKGAHPTASGGNLELIEPWVPENSQIAPLAFEYQLRREESEP